MQRRYCGSKNYRERCCRFQLTLAYYFPRQCMYIYPFRLHYVTIALYSLAEYNRSSIIE
jgi:hypothetical protein